MEFKDFIVSEKERITDALDEISENSNGIVFIENAEHSIVGSLSDGDIRRFLMTNGSIADPVVKAMNKDFKSSVNIVEAKALAEEYNVVPVLNEKGEASCIVLKDIIIPQTKLNVPVVIQAGGLGTRLYPYTKILPKPLIPIGDLPIIELIINRFVEFGCSEFYVIVNHKKEMIKSYFAEIEKPYSIEFIDETKPLGTGGGLSMLEGKINNTFIFANCDTFLDCNFSDVLKEHKKANNKVSIICSQMDMQIPYGVVKIDENKKITEFVEKPRMQFLSNVGIYIVEPEVIRMIPKDTKIHFTTICEDLMQNKGVGVFEILEEEWNDMGEIDKLNKMIDK